MNRIEQVRDYWNRRPCNIRHSSKTVGSCEYFDEVEAKKHFVEPHIPYFATFDRWKNKKVLEIGCGIGTDAANFAREGASVTVIEISDRSLDICQRRFQVYGLSGRFYRGDCEELSSVVPVQPYDLIYSFGAIHHTPRPQRIFEEIIKYCVPETEIRIMLYSKWSWKVFWIVLKYGKGTFWRTSPLIRTFSEAQEGCPVTHVFSFRGIRKLMSDFDILEIRKEHIFPYRIDKYVGHQYQKVWYFRWMPTVLFRWLEHHFGWHTLVRAKHRSPMNIHS